MRALALGVPILALAGCSGAATSAPLAKNVPGPVLILAVDGFEWDVVYGLLASERIPNIAQALERGTFGVLRTFDPNYSPMLWTTAATGRRPQDHGIEGFTTGEGEQKRLFTSEDRRAKAFWNILTDYELSCDVIGWWNTFPVEPIDGWMVAQTNTLERDRVIRKGTLLPETAQQVWPAEHEQLVLELLEQEDAQLETTLLEVFGEAPTQDEDFRWTESTWAFRADATYVSVLHERLKLGPPADVTAIYLGGPDVIGHRFWSAYDPASFGLTEESREVRQYGHVVEDYYCYVDRTLGELLAAFPSDTTLLMLSDHGMGPNPRAEDWSVKPGDHHGNEHAFFVASGPSIQASGIAPTEIAFQHVRMLGSLLDVCPTLLACLGIPSGQDMPGRPIVKIFASEPQLPARIDTHDDAEWLAGRPENPLIHRSPERLDQLENLGYIGDDE